MARQGQGPQQVLSSSSCSNGGGLGASRSPPKSQPDRAVRGRSQKDRPRDPAETPSRILPRKGKCPRRRRVRERVRRAPSWENGGAKPQWGGPVGCLGGIWGRRDKAGLGGPCSTQVWGCLRRGPAAVLGNGHLWGQQEPPNSRVGANRGGLWARGPSKGLQPCWDGAATVSICHKSRLWCFWDPEPPRCAGASRSKGVRSSGSQNKGTGPRARTPEEQSPASPSIPAGEPRVLVRKQLGEGRYPQPQVAHPKGAAGGLHPQPHPRCSWLGSSSAPPITREPSWCRGAAQSPPVVLLLIVTCSLPTGPEPLSLPAPRCPRALAAAH